MVKTQFTVSPISSDFWKKKDIVSYLLSIMVFLIHISSFGQYENTGSFMSRANTFMEKLFCDGFTSYAVPLYFIISGALFFRDYSNRNYLSKIKRRIKTLLIPYLIWNTVWLLFEITASYTFISNYFAVREKFVLSFSSVVDSILHYKCNTPFWFIFELMFFILLSPVIDLLVRKRYVGICVTALLAVLCLFHIGLPESIFYSQTAIVYYFIGAIIGKHYFNVFCKRSSRVTQIISALILIVAAPVFFFETGVDRKPYFMFLLILGAWAFWNVTDLFVYKLPSYGIFKDSFAVYAMHINVSAVIAKLLYLVFPKSEWMALPNFILTLSLTLAFIRLFCCVLHKISPKLHGLLTGGR